MSILVITNKIDLPSDEVIRYLQNKNAEVFRLNTEDLCEGFDFKIGLDNQYFDGRLYSSLRSINLSNIKSIFYRRPKKPEIVISDKAQKSFIEAERSAFLNWLWESLNCFWVSKPSNIKTAESKINQLCIAPKLGFKIPKTIITNNPEDVRRFYYECDGDIVNKTLIKGMIEQDGKTMAIYTHRIEEKHLEILESIRSVPCIFQKRIEKKLELRITVVGNQVFAAEIHSQISQKTKDDWRRYDIDNTPHKIHNLPLEIKKSCINLVRYYGLAFGAIDMIVTPSGDYVFLEINPNGQWLWIERLTGLPISEAIADILIKGAI